MLQGVRILEIEGIGPGPFAAMHLADLGAEVIVIHRKSTEGQITSDTSLLDRGKRSIALDLKDPEDIEIAKGLIAKSDALIEGFRPGVLERLGLGPDDCFSLNPALVFGRITGWGQSGPRAKQAGHDLNYISTSGAAWYASSPEDAPMTPPTLVGDIGGGANYLVIGILAGILKARATGQGTVVDAAIVDGSAHMMNLLMAIRQSGQFVDKRGNSLLDGPHWSRTYRCSDGKFISVQCLEPKFYSEFLNLMGLSDDPKFTKQYDRKSWPSQAQELASIFEQQSSEKWDALFENSDACVALVKSPSESAQDPHMKSRSVWDETSGYLQAAPAPRFGEVPENVNPAPKRDQHRVEILTEISKL